MREKVLLLSTWYPTCQEERGLQCTWAIADLIAELQKCAVSTVVIAARAQDHAIRGGYVHGQLVISVPSYLVIRRRVLGGWFARKTGEGGKRDSNLGEEASQFGESMVGTSGGGYVSAKTKPAGAEGANVLGLVRLGKKVVRVFFEQVQRPLLLAKLFRTLEQVGRFDRVIIHGRVAQHLEFVRRFWTGPVSVCFHETDYHERSTAAALQGAGAKVRRVAFRSERLHERFVQGGLIAPGVPYVVIPSGVPAKAIKARAEYKTKVPGVLRLVCVSSMIRRKKLGMLIETLSRIDSFDWSLDLYGAGPLRSELEAQTIALGLENKVIFRGFVPQDEIMRRYSTYDVFVLLSECETFGMVYTEALSQGLFVIGSKGEGIDGILDDGVNGFLVSPAEPARLLEKLDFINRLSPEDEARFKDRIHDSMRHLTIEGIGAKYLDFMIKDE